MQAYADDSCTWEETAQVEDHLRDCPGCALKALALERLKRATRSHGVLYRPSAEFQNRVMALLHGTSVVGIDAEEVVQGRMLRGTAGGAASRGKTFGLPRKIPGWVPTLAAVALFAILITGLDGFWLARASRGQALAELLDMHVATLASVNPVDVVSTDRHTVKPWFAGKLPFAFNLPELQDSGYNLIGGKLVYLDGKPTAQLVYGLAKHELSVFVFEERPANSFGKTPWVGNETAWRDKGFAVEQWNEAGLSYVVVSDANGADVRRLAGMVRSAARP